MYSKEKQKILFDLSKSLLEEKPSNTLKEASLQVENLRVIITYHEWRYYILDQPVISDFEYDSLFHLLKKLETDFPTLLRSDSPTQRVSNDLSNDFPSVEHLNPMLSLENSYNAEDLEDFDKRVRKLLNLDETEAVAYCVEPKFDGGTIVLVYEGDQLKRAATRGNGIKGEEVTANIKAIRSIPLRANFAQYGIQKVELRGEALIRKEHFVKVNAKRAEKGDALFANPRNAATGGLRLKDSSKVQERALDAFIYQLGYIEGANSDEVKKSPFETHDKSIEALANLGFKVPKKGLERKHCNNITEVLKYCQDWEAKREDYAFEIDGMVIKVDNLEWQESCGATSHHPRWAIAYKFKAKQATTKLLDIEYQVGRTGAVTPVAKLEAVDLAGVRVSSVSLHNEDLIQAKDIRIGDIVLIERAGDVIPKVVKPIETLRNGQEKIVAFPKECPACQAKLVRPEGEAIWRCLSRNCAAQKIGRLIHFVSKGAMDIDGFGEAYVERFQSAGILNGLKDVYQLDYEKIKTFDGFGQRSIEKLSKAIEKSKLNPIWRLIYGLGIRYVGKGSSKILAAEVVHIKDLRNWTVDQLMDLEDIGPKVAQIVFDTFSQEDVWETLNTLEGLGVNMNRLPEEEKKTVLLEGPFAGKKVLFTGTLQELKRQEAKKMVEDAGGKVASSITSTLSYLVAGEKPGSKYKKAQDLGIEILSETAFLAIFKRRKDMKQLNRYVPLVEEAIQKLGVDPKIARTDDPLRWFFHRGGAQMAMFLRESVNHQKEKRETLVVVSPILPIPETAVEQLKLFKDLLTFSHKLVTESFSLAEDWVYLSSTYYLSEMRHAEVANLLDSLSFYAQMFTERLRAEYLVKEPKTTTEDKTEA